MIKQSTIFAVAVLSIATTNSNVHAQQADIHHLRKARTQHFIVCDQYRCSEQPASTARVKVTASASTHIVADANGNVVGSRPAGCPHAFCGCEASRFVFGEIRPELNLASNWIRKFPRTLPAPRMVAARNHHVMVLLSQVNGDKWLVHDGNSGGGLTREHVVSIKGFVIVDPHAARTAQTN